MDNEPRAPLGRVIRLFRPYRRKLGAVGALIVLSSVVSLASPFLLREILDVALPNRDARLLSMLALGMIVIAVTTSVFDVLQTFISTTVGQRVMHDLRKSVYNHLQRMSLAFFTRTKTGEVQSRIANDIGAMQAVVTTTATSFISYLTSVIATIAAMVALDWRLTLISLGLLPVFVWISRKVGKERRRITTQRQIKMASMASMVQESLSISGILLGRTMGRTGTLTDRFAASSDDLADLEVRSSMAGRWRQSSIQIVMAAMPAVVYWAVGWTGAVSVGTLVAFTTLQTSMFRPSVQLLQLGVEVQSSMSLFGRIFEYLDLKVDIRPGDRVLDRVKGDVRFEDVDFSYGAGPTLTGIDVAVPPGTRLAIVGETGSGKTTLSYLLPRLYDVTSGRVTVDGVDVRDLTFESLAETVGVVSQETYLFHASVADNLRFANPDATDEELHAAARAARIHDHLMSLPEGYDTLVGERGYRFSGGEKQRLAIARTLLRNPPVLILDEATSSLDTQTERAVQEALDELAEGRTTLTIAHRLSTVRDADQIIVLDAGRIVERGTHDELLALGGHYAALVNRDELTLTATEAAG
ncbi:ABC transporter ATP-binding protein [Herbidospora galbida]|uniref:ABC transporter ATP-binding protein n=1 Tax=Herbidospora galbida TaxID=2575442 RepID=A0A4U3LUY6_9ACTN|nr:ABC transporter ATP-binding protein [Herbidospora galbida]TKK79054.1 ABC transporter ATP-binding protein [Herbidospora galbida]